MHALVLVALLAAAAPEPQAPTIQGLMVGDKAPFAGYLVPELRFEGYLHNEIDLHSCNLKLEFAQTANKRALEMVQELTAPVASTQTSWWQENKGWVGFSAGVVTGVLAVVGGIWAAQQLAEVTK